MAIIPLRAWYIPEYEPISSIEQRPHDLRLSKNSLLKSGLRADFLDDLQTVRQSLWFQRYMAGAVVEFYIEGSGTYAIANLDIISHEIYFNKQETVSQYDPVIFFSPQSHEPDLSAKIEASLQYSIEQISARLPLGLEIAPRNAQPSHKSQNFLLSRLKKSLLFVADVSPLGDRYGQPLFSPQVCVEVGYALQIKRSSQILLVQMHPHPVPFPIDLPFHELLSAPDPSTLNQLLPKSIEQRLELLHLLKN
jgi:hypothetical protein